MVSYGQWHCFDIWFETSHGIDSTSKQQPLASQSPDRGHTLTAFNTAPLLAPYPYHPLHPVDGHAQRQSSAGIHSTSGLADHDFRRHHDDGQLALYSNHSAEILHHSFTSRQGKHGNRVRGNRMGSIRSTGDDGVLAVDTRAIVANFHQLQRPYTDKSMCDSGMRLAKSN